MRARAMTTIEMLLCLAVGITAGSGCSSPEKIEQQVDVLEYSSGQAEREGRVQDAFALEEEAFTEARKLGRSSPRYIRSAGLLAQFHLQFFNYARAESLLLEGVDCAQAAGDTTDLVQLYSLLGSTYLNTADYEAAEMTANRALSFAGAADVRPHVWLSFYEQRLVISLARGDLREARERIQEADSASLALSKQSRDDLAPMELELRKERMAQVEINMLTHRAELLHLEGHPDRALSLLMEAAAASRGIGDAAHEIVCAINAVSALDAMHRYKEADAIIADYGMMEDSTFAMTPVPVIQLLTHYALKRDMAKCEVLASKAAEVYERILRRLFTEMPERRMLLYLGEQQHFVDKIISVALSFDSQRLHDCATQVIRQRKERARTSLAGWLQAVHREGGPAAQVTLAQLLEGRRQIGVWSTNDGSPEARDSLAKYTALAKAAEAKLAREVPKAGRALQVPENHDLVRAIDRNTCMLEFTSYYPANMAEASLEKQWSKRHYAVSILTAEGVGRVTDLGPASEIDGLVEKLRVDLRARGGWSKDSEQLRNRIYGKVQRYIAGKDQLIIAPDGDLNLLPFSLLEADYEGGVGQRQITYVGCSSEIAGGGRPAGKKKNNAVVIGSPDFDALPRTADGRGAEAAQPQVWASLYFGPLAGTRAECEAIAALLPNAQKFLGAAATKRALQEVHSPSILHIATHGVYLGEKARVVDKRERYQLSIMTGVQRVANDNPLIRTGLALSGANYHRAGARSRAIATGMDMSALDLSGTELVVLSACDTGLGPIGAGQGVFGMRRALATAGAEAEIISLWAVDDTATCALMVDCYLHMKRGVAPVQALHQAQTDMRLGRVVRVLRDAGIDLAPLIPLATTDTLQKEELWRRPYYWAGFVYSRN